MNAGLRITSLFFAVLIFYLSINSGGGSLFVDLSAKQAAACGHSAAYLTADVPVPAFLSEKDKEAFNFSGNLKNNKLPFRLDLVPVISRLLWSGKGCSRPGGEESGGLAFWAPEFREIIFPFHGFW